MNAPADLPGPRKARIEIIPLIDVIFFLLATFVLFTLSLDKIRALEVPMPETGDKADSDDTVFLQASDGGTYYWKSGAEGSAEPLTIGELGPRLDLYRRSVPRPRVFIRGDGRASFGAAVRALDEVRRARIEQVSIETVPSPTGR
jgi:biopolymer transport protein ExbD